MKVVLDARWILPCPSGIGVYTRELVRRLPALAPELEFTALFRSEALRAQTLAGLDPERFPNLRSVRLPYGPFSPAGQARLPLWLRRFRADLFHSPNYMLPFAAFPRDRAGRLRAVTTVHDVIPFVLPDHAPRSRKARLWPLFVRCVRESLARSDAVLTVSETSRRDLVTALRLAPARAGRVRVVLNGVDETFAPAADGGRPGAGARTVLYVGRMDPYKNLPLLMRAFAQLRKAVDFPVGLRVAGPEDPRYPEARRAAGALGISDAVHFEGFVSGPRLRELYRTSALLVNPSRYEGFGLPIMEAMRSGLPVVCADGGAQREVAGDAALVVPCNDAPALAEAMRRILCEPDLARRLRARGLERAEPFTWDKTARATLAVYRELLEKKP